MPVRDRLVVAGMSATEAQASIGTTADNLTSAGTTQATAVTLGADVNRFTTVGANSGCIMTSMNAADNIVVINAGANALKLYPPVGAQINALGANAGYSIATATPFCYITCTSPTQYHCFQSA